MSNLTFQVFTHWPTLKIFINMLKVIVNIGQLTLTRTIRGHFEIYHKCWQKISKRKRGNSKVLICFSYKTISR